ncbi:ParB family chromosome partitioning protein [Palleronia aestuarii]|uniref:ParB family chromosome partitioning protein n=1 Tax=Palleronia aestuarii TaxID=568105 RepID=A0A2W7PY62_9RHOB|nr:ParB N-terminal domain-containing protein [Palleronia aestuarii]PZX14499.1 ParB family chromosome partitioning protein [Palleronia aestuarii]
MAKRRKLETPDPNDLADFEARFRRETRTGPAAPIGAMAADSASAADLRTPDQRAEAERHRAGAEAFADAKGRGLVLQEVPISAIDDTVLVRDRSVIDEGELRELRDSIGRNGLRLPIEVFELPDPRGEKIFGLLSGYRRLLAIRQLFEMTELEKFGTVKAILRDPEAMGGRFAAMVEENEVRSGLSHFERGRIAVIAAGQGGYPNVEAAVDALFASASKAKRSKIRSFAAIFEDLGDLLHFPETMTEKQGLRLASALRSGAEPALREALASVRPEGFEDEWAAIEPAIRETEEAGAPDRSRGGRPSRRAASPSGGRSRSRLSSGITITKSRDAGGFTLRLEGGGLDEALIESLIAEIERMLERP